MSAKQKIRKINAELEIAFEDRREIKNSTAHYELASHHDSLIVRQDARARLEELLRELYIVEGEINRLFTKRRKIEKTSIRINRILDALSAS